MNPMFVGFIRFGGREIYKSPHSESRYSEFSHLVWGRGGIYKSPLNPPPPLHSESRTSLNLGHVDIIHNQLERGVDAF